MALDASRSYVILLQKLEDVRPLLPMLCGIMRMDLVVHHPNQSQSILLVHLKNSVE
jgi:hypothetical protein